MSCPACKSNDYKQLHNDPIVQDQNEQGILPVNYILCSCKVCNLVFKKNIPAPDQLKRFYESMTIEKWDYKVVYPHEVRLRKILDNVPAGSDVLDVGCFMGRLLATQAGRLNCYGVEPNQVAAAQAKLKGINVIGTFATENTLGERKFDVIILVDVFEHLTDPMKEILLLHQHLKSNGRLLIVTGTTDCFPAKLCGPYFWYFRLAEHLIFLNKSFAKWMANELDSNFTYEKIRHFEFSWTKYESVKKMIYEFLWHLTWRWFSPNSPYVIIKMKRFARLKSPFLMTAWKDHALLTLSK